MPWELTGHELVEEEQSSGKTTGPVSAPLYHLGDVGQLVFLSHGSSSLLHWISCPNSHFIIIKLICENAVRI